MLKMLKLMMIFILTCIDMLTGYDATVRLPLPRPCPNTFSWQQCSEMA